MKRSFRLLSEDLAAFMENKMIKWELQNFCEKTLFFSEKISSSFWRRLYSSWSGHSALLWEGLLGFFEETVQSFIRTISSLLWEQFAVLYEQNISLFYEKTFQSCTRRPSSLVRKDLPWPSRTCMIRPSRLLWKTFLPSMGIPFSPLWEYLPIFYEKTF